MVVEFEFLPFDSPFYYLQNQTFGKPLNYWLSETYLENLVSVYSFSAFLDFFREYFVKKVRFGSKLISYSESASKTASIDICCE